ncbi:MAG: TIR domain-containing protein [Methanomethylophilus alvi]|nr:TIR domain-containing protein [Methanomethylophilus alvi]
MSANNVFVSYKYHDSDVKQLGNYATTVRDYVDYLERMFDRSEKVYYRGEEDGNDLSELTEDTIRQILSDKIFYTTVTVVLMSPNMYDRSLPENEQWSGAFRSQEDLCDADRRSVGRPIGTVRSFTDGWSPKTPVPTSLTDTLDGLTPSDVLLVRRHFEDLEHLFVSLKGVMRADTSACFFVGNAQMDGVTVRVDEVIPEIVRRAGLRVEDVTKVRVRDARRDLEDYRIEVSRVAG